MARRVRQVKTSRRYRTGRIASLDAEVSYCEIYRILLALEFPWDMNQALSFASYRTYAAQSIGGLLARTGELTVRTQKRYDDTALLLERVLRSWFDSNDGRTALRRINQMHHAFDISDDDFRYVLSTFVVVPRRWIDRFG